MRLVLLSILLVSAIAADLSAEAKLQLQTTTFQKWRLDHGRFYSNVAEYEKRLSIFKSNYDVVEETNAKNLGYTLELNQFADLTLDEFSQMYLMPEQEHTEGAHPVREEPLVGAPESVDWVAAGCVGPVKNQGSCGSCWAFSAVGAMETMRCIKGDKVLEPLSEQQVVDCSKLFLCNGCNGGFPQGGFKGVDHYGGIMRQADYPYTAKTGNCHMNKTKVVAKFSGIHELLPTSESSLTSHLVNHPIAVSIDAGHQEFQLYKSGVLSIPSCSSIKLNHSVLSVGYGKEDGKDYYLVRNSWGSSWGAKGYFKLARGHNMCGIATAACYVDYKK